MLGVKTFKFYPAPPLKVVKGPPTFFSFFHIIAMGVKENIQENKQLAVNNLTQVLSNQIFGVKTFEIVK